MDYFGDRHLVSEFTRLGVCFMWYEWTEIEHTERCHLIYPLVGMSVRVSGVREGVLYIDGDVRKIEEADEHEEERKKERKKRMITKGVYMIYYGVVEFLYFTNRAK